MLSVTIGHVIQVWAKDSIPPKPKRVILIAKYSSMFLGVFINSEINPFAFSAQVAHLHLEWKKNASRKYLAYDSFVDCNEPKEYDEQEILKSLKKDPANHLGVCCAEDLTLIQETVKNSITLEPFFKRQYFNMKRPRIKR